MTNGQGMSMALKTMTRMIRLGELGEQGMQDAISMASRIVNDEGASERDRVNAGKLLAMVQRMSFDAAVEINKNERLDSDKATENVKLYGGVDLSKV